MLARCPKGKPANPGGVFCKYGKWMDGARPAFAAEFVLCEVDGPQ